ncbi:hypothetical protein V8C40DRAFT_244621 [Trichoderma camerunense]
MCMSITLLLIISLSKTSPLQFFNANFLTELSQNYPSPTIHISMAGKLFVVAAVGLEIPSEHYNSATSQLFGTERDD